MKLRDYQISTHDAALEQWKLYRKLLAVLPTGTGKTIIFSFLAKSIVTSGGRALILANRNVLLQQARGRLMASTGIEAAIEQADQCAAGCMESVVVGSVQTMMNVNRLEKYHREEFSHIIVDEADQCLADSFQRIFSYFDKAKILGVTATPDRGDMRDLGEFFESICYEYRLDHAVRDGWLVPVRVQTIPLNIRLPDINKRDWSDIEIGSALSPYIPHIAEELWKHCHNRKLLVFAPLCAISREIRKALEKVGFRSYYADGEYLDEMEKWDSEGTGACMTNAMLLGRGYDCTNIDAVAILRATKVRSLVCQMYGRATRPIASIAHALGDAPNAAYRRKVIANSLKPNMLCADFLFHSENHSLCMPAQLFADNQDVADKLADKIRVGGGDGESTDLDEEELKDAREKVLREREEKLARELSEQRRKKAKLVDPLQFAVSAGDEQAVTYQAATSSERETPSLEMIRDIEAFGVSTTGMDAGLARITLTTLNERHARGMADPKQIRLLERECYGFKHAALLTRGEAGKIIGRIKANGFRMPPALEPERDKWNRLHR